MKTQKVKYISKYDEEDEEMQRYAKKCKDEEMQRYAKKCKDMQR